MGRYRLDSPAPLHAALLVAVALAALGWPAPVQPAAQVIGGGGGDFPSIAWGLWRVSESLPWVPVWFEDIFAPQAERFSWAQEAME